MEILFKALKDDMSNCNWVEGSLIYDVYMTPRIQENSDVTLFTTCIKGTQCMYTNLRIKGVMLFQGDIFKYSKHNGYNLLDFTAEVVWYNEYACFGYRKLGSDFIEAFRAYDELEHDVLAWCEIIGNVHD